MISHSKLTRQSFWGIVVKRLLSSLHVVSRDISLTVPFSTGCPNRHGNSVTNLISSLLWTCIVMPNFKNYDNIIIFARVYFEKTVNDWKDVSIMSPQDKQWRQTSLLCLYTVTFYYTVTNCKHNRQKSYELQLSQ